MYDQSLNFEDMKIEDYIKDSEVLRAMEYRLQKSLDDALMYFEEDAWELITDNLQNGIDDEDGGNYVLNYIFQKAMESWGYFRQN